MIKVRLRGWLFSPLVGIALAIVVAGQSVAASWSGPTKFSNADWFDGIATPGGSTVIAALTKCVGADFCGDKVILRRSTDGGATWPYRYVLPGNNQDAAIAGRGNNVDLVWASENDSGLFYAHSGNGGQTFGPRKGISKSYSEAEPHVARGPDGLVVICWGDWSDGDHITCRVSMNGGETFGKKSSFATSDVYFSAVAAGDGSAYVAFHNRQDTPVVRRTTDGGQTWQLALKLTDEERAFGPSITADGDKAYVAYGTVNANEHRQVRIRRTSDRGASWSDPHLMAPDTLSPYGPQVSLANGVVRGLFGTGDGVFYTQSPDGVTWTTPEKVTTNALDAFVGWAGRPIVVYHRFYQRAFALFSTYKQ